MAVRSYLRDYADPSIGNPNDKKAVYLGGKYIELGINRNGTFGTENQDAFIDLPAGFFGRSPTGPVTYPWGTYNEPIRGGWGLGLAGDADGFGIGSELQVDYFQPATLEERYGFSWDIGGTQGFYTQSEYNRNNTNSAQASGFANWSLTDTTVVGSSTASAVLTADHPNGVRFTIEYVLEENSRSFTTNVTLENIGLSVLDDIVFMRNVDPDNVYDYGTTDNTGGGGDQDDFSTLNEVVSQFGVNGASVSLITATSRDQASTSPDYFSVAQDETVFAYKSSDPRSSVFIGNYSLTPPRDPAEWSSAAYLAGTNPFMQRAVGSSEYDDKVIGITFDIGTLNPGDSTSFSYDTYVSGLAAFNAFVDTTPPTFVSAATTSDGTKVILTYDEALSATTALATDFAVTVAGAAASISGVATNGSTVELSLSSAVQSGQSVTVAYTDPTGGDDGSATQDAAGNDAASLSATAVTNNSSVGGGGSGSSSSGSGSSSGDSGGSSTSSGSAATPAIPSDTGLFGSLAQSTDADGDGLREVMVAADGRTVDGNRDGIADYLQRNVVGLRLIINGEKGDDYGALTHDPSASLSGVALRTANSDGSVTISGRDGLGRNYFLPYGTRPSFAGLVEFELSGIQSGSSSEVVIHLARGDVRQGELSFLDANGSRLESFQDENGRVEYAFVDGQTRVGNAYLRFNYLTNRFEEYLDADGNPLYRYVDSDGDGVMDEIRLTVVDGDPAWDGDGVANGIVVDPGIEVYGDRVLSGGKKRDVITGNVLANRILGKNGRDLLIGYLGDDIILGGKGNDLLDGGEGQDRLTGGPGKDRYVYDDVNDSLVNQRDTVNFGADDRFDFRAMDADATLDGVQSFTFIGKKAFSGAAGQLRATRGILEADLDGDGQSDFAINLRNSPLLTSAHLML